MKQTFDEKLLNFIIHKELGGKNPNIIFDDANLEECVKTSVLSSFSNQGEICLCGSRILVQEGIYDEFVKHFVEATKQLIVGDPKDPKTQMGALVSNIHREKVESYIALAQTEGGKKQNTLFIFQKFESRFNSNFF